MLLFLKDFEAKNLEDISVITHARGSVHAEKKRDFSEKDLKETDRQTDRQTERERESKASLKASIGRILFKHLTQQNATERSLRFSILSKIERDDDDENAFVHVAVNDAREDVFSLRVSVSAKREAQKLSKDHL